MKLKPILNFGFLLIGCTFIAGGKDCTSANGVQMTCGNSGSGQLHGGDQFLVCGYYWSYHPFVSDPRIAQNKCMPDSRSCCSTPGVMVYESSNDFPFFTVKVVHSFQMEVKK
jgi:hypothetical protein